MLTGWTGSTAALTCWACGSAKGCQGRLEELSLQQLAGRAACWWWPLMQLLCRAGRGASLAAGKGSIINIGSIAGTGALGRGHMPTVLHWAA